MEWPYLAPRQPIQVPWQPPRKLLQTPELRQINIHVTHSTPPDWIEDKYSNYHFLVSVTAWCLRFINRLHPPDPNLSTRQLIAVERKLSELLLIRLSQARSFQQDKHHLLNDQPISPSSRLRALNPFLDKNQLIRVGGRLSNSALSQSQRHPFIVDSRDKLIQLLFNHMHVCLGHCGPSLLLCSVGWRFHVLSARRLSRTVCSQCRTCRQASAKTKPQMLGELPEDRVTQHPAFSTVGVDYAGPFLLKKGHKSLSRLTLQSLCVSPQKPLTSKSFLISQPKPSLPT